MRKLGGWWRLWIVLTASYGIVITTFFILEWPTAETTPHRSAYVYQMSAESQRLLQAPTPSMDDLIESLRQADDAGDTDSATIIAYQIRAARENPWTLSPRLVFGLNGYPFTLPGATTEAEIDAFVEDYARILNAEAAAQERRKAKLFVLLLIIPPASILIIAQLIAWIWRGFRPTQSSNIESTAHVVDSNQIVEK